MTGLPGCSRRAPQVCRGAVSHSHQPGSWLRPQHFSPGLGGNLVFRPRLPSSSPGGMVFQTCNSGHWRRLAGRSPERTTLCVPRSPDIPAAPSRPQSVAGSPLHTWDAPAPPAALGKSCPLGTQSFPEPGSVGASVLPVTYYPVPAALTECPGYICVCVCWGKV